MMPSHHMIVIGERMGGIKMTIVIKELLSWIFNNHQLATKDKSVYKRVANADFQAANEVHHYNVNLIKLG